MLIQAVQLVAAVLVVVLPGLALLLALGVRDRLWWAGLAAPVTLGLILLTSLLTGLTGVRFSALTAGVVVVLVVAAAVVVRRRVAPGADDAGVHTDTSLGGFDLTSAKVTGGLLLTGGVAVAVSTWWHALGSWATPSQEHDPIKHSVLTAYIHFTGRAAPWQLAPVTVLADQPVSFYPPGFPQLGAVLTDLTGGNAFTGMNLASVATLAVLWPVSAGALAAAVVRLAVRNSGWTYLAAGIAGLIAAVLYKPTISLPHDGGVLPQAVACVLVPGLLAAMLTVQRRHWGGAVLIALGVAGVVAMHSSAVVSIALTGVAAAVGLLVTADGRARLRELLLPLVAAGVLAGLLLVPVLFGSASQGDTVADHPADIVPEAPLTAVRHAVALTYGGFLDPDGTINQVALGVCTLLAAAAVLLVRRCWPVLLMWLAWVAVVAGFLVAPDSAVSSTIGAFYYQGFFRLEANMYLVVPALIGVGGVLLTAGAVHFVRGWRFAPAVALTAVLVVSLVLGATTFAGYADRNTDALAARYRLPDINRYDGDDVAAADWLHQHTRPGEVIMNSGNDGSTLAYVRYGLPVVNTASMGQPILAPYTVDLLSRFHDYPHDQGIQRILHEHNVCWVYVDSFAPIILADPRTWVGTDRYTLAPGLTGLAGLPGLTPAFRSGHVTVYRLDLAAVPVPPAQTPQADRPAG